MKLLEKIDRMAVAELSAEERDELRSALTLPMVLKAVRLVKHQMDLYNAQLLQCNLSAMEGVHKAVKLQGQVYGMGLALELLGECAGAPAKENV